MIIPRTPSEIFARTDSAKTQEAEEIDGALYYSSPPDCIGERPDKPAPSADFALHGKRLLARGA